MSKVVIDTDVLIDVLRGREPARDFLLDATRHAVPCCSVISVAEIHAGMRPEETEVTGRLLDGLVILPVTRPIAELAGHFKWRSKNRKLELVDCLIAATAVVETAALATANVKDYPMGEVSLLPMRSRLAD